MILKKVVWSVLSALVLFTSAQAEDVIVSRKPITWLGLDFSLARFIGAAAQFGSAGDITLAEMREKYMPGWNQLFVNERKKYDVARYVKRDAVSFVLDISAADNDAVSKDLFSMNPDDGKRLRAVDISDRVGQMDFKAQHGVGYVIFIEYMDKGAAQAGGWITFVDMDTKKVLHTHRAAGKPGGFGFRNYWAAAFLDILKDTHSND